MPVITPRHAATAGVAVLTVLAVAWFAWPRPIPIDIASVTKGPMAVTVDDEGKTRVRHVYTVSAPISGKVLRISHPFGAVHPVSIHIGDEVKADETVVAVMQPSMPTFLDVRTREELQALLAAADAAIALAEAEIRRIEVTLEFARDELKRAQALSRTGAIAARALEKAQLDVAANEAGLASAKAQLGVRRSERASVAARLIDPSTVASQPVHCCINIKAPVTGRVLKIVQDSEAVVAVGAPLLEIGNPLDLEVVADLLSTDAVQIRVGHSVAIDGWGGATLRGRVTRVDPAGFLKVSALGIEEQRVRTTIDFVDPFETWSPLGHDFRVIVHVTVWSGDGVLAVPVGALFRKGNDWAVYAVKGGRARTTLVKIGHKNAQVAEVRSGLAPGDRVILHPSDRVNEGSAVAQR